MMKKICGKCKEGKLEMYGVTDSGMWKVQCPVCYHRSLEKSWGLKSEAGSESEQPPKKIKVKKDIETQEHNLC